MLEPDEARAGEQELYGYPPLLTAPRDEPRRHRSRRPHQDFVEREARRYWQRIIEIGALTKPGLTEIRAAAMPILCQGLRNRQGHRRQYSVDAMQLHALEQRWIKPPYPNLLESPSYIDALIQLATDADWMAEEVTLPYHPEPEHPPVYYSIDSHSGMPIPAKESLIRGDYVFTHDGCRVTQAGFIHPWRDLTRYPTINDLDTRGWDVCYRLGITGIQVVIFIHGVSSVRRSRRIWLSPLNRLHFTPHPDDPKW